MIMKLREKKCVIVKKNPIKNRQILAPEPLHVEQSDKALFNTWLPSNSVTCVNCPWLSVLHFKRLTWTMEPNNV